MLQSPCTQDDGNVLRRALVKKAKLAWYSLRRSRELPRDYATYYDIVFRFISQKLACRERLQERGVCADCDIGERIGNMCEIMRNTN
jgi:hypothetical protein